MVVFILFISLISLTGCATGRKQNLEIQRLRNQISVLETQVQIRDQEIASLREDLEKVAEKKVSAKQFAEKRIIGEIKSRPSVKHIQIALKNAGFNPGPADGRMGRRTRDAIKAFQRANNLVVDGKVGKQTWNLLKEYLYKKVK